MRALPLLLVVVAVASAAPVSPAAAAEAIASGTPGYQLMYEDASSGKRIVAVRLDRRVPEQDLGRLAEAVRTRFPTPATRTQVQFYLAPQRSGEMPWATAVFAPDLRLQISGLTVEEEEVLHLEAQKETRPIIGAWLTGPPASPGSLMIVREKGRLTAEWRLRGGHRTQDEVVESRWNGGQRYDVKGDAGQHYVVTRAGTLELRDARALIATAEPMLIARPSQPTAQALPRPPAVPTISPGHAPPPSGAAAVAPKLMMPVPSQPAALPLQADPALALRQVPADGSSDAAAAGLPAPPQAATARAANAVPAVSVAAAPAPTVGKTASRKVQQRHAQSRPAAGLAKPVRGRAANDPSVAALMAAKMGQ